MFEFYYVKIHEYSYLMALDFHMHINNRFIKDTKNIFNLLNLNNEYNIKN